MKKIKSKYLKNKKILFIDFNGVISYKQFWYSFEKKNNELLKNIQKILFNENIDLVIKWMKGKYKTGGNYKIFI